MGIIDKAQKDWQAITGNTTGFGVQLSFIAPTGETAVVNGLHTKHHLGIDADGKPINTKLAAINVSEKLLTDAGYPVRDSNKEVKLKGHRVNAKDSTGVEKQYVIIQWLPDETVGAITLFLGDYKP